MCLRWTSVTLCLYSGVAFWGLVVTVFLRSSVVREAVLEGVLVLRDLDVGMSVTNDAEAVVRWALRLPDWDHRWPIVYRDSQGHYDALEHVRGEFSGFVTLGCARTAAAAVERLVFLRGDKGKCTS